MDSLVGIFKDMTDLRRSEVELKKLKSFNWPCRARSRHLARAESRDPYTAGHQRRVADLAQPSPADGNAGRTTTIHMAGLIHDIGKINVPRRSKQPGKLNSGEFA